MHLYGYSLEELENMIPWERKIYLGMLNAYISEENLKTQQKMANEGLL
jgi:hypothetical protein|tara:strand:+ start:131 stop:274 length:144 start_codon:yes stop_codon:yes gene_type:complete